MCLLESSVSRIRRYGIGKSARLMQRSASEYACHPGEDISGQLEFPPRQFLDLFDFGPRLIIIASLGKPLRRRAAVDSGERARRQNGRCMSASDAVLVSTSVTASALEVRVTSFSVPF